jgi:hypothetical protein
MVSNSQGKNELNASREITLKCEVFAYFLATQKLYHCSKRVCSFSLFIKRGSKSRQW